MFQLASLYSAFMVFSPHVTRYLQEFLFKKPTRIKKESIRPLSPPITNFLLLHENESILPDCVIHLAEAMAETKMGCAPVNLSVLW